jgi:hypothetical protein
MCGWQRSAFHAGPHPLDKGRQRLRRRHFVNPGGICLVHIEHCGVYRTNHARDAARLIPRGQGRLRSGNVQQRLPVSGCKGVNVEERTNALADFAGYAGNDHSLIGMAAQNGIGDILVLEDTHDVLDMRVQIDRMMRQMGALPDPSQRRRVDIMSCFAKRARDPSIDPAALERSTH